MNLFLNGILLMLLLAAFSVPQTEAAVSRGVFKNDAHPGKCYVNANLIMNLGDTAKYPDMDCARIICENDSMAEIHTCGVVSITGCTLGAVKFPDADYPKCCEREVICAK
uniref:CG34215-like protein n=1 Tax=Drosophila silvestris TaxID=47010 RepID=B7UEB0_DROSL|nr:CG34215-like protein [Drosophila silvestris]